MPLRLIVCSFHLESLAEVDILGSDKGTLLLLAAIFRLVFTSIIPNYLDDHGAVTFSHHTLNVEVSGIYRWLAYQFQTYRLVILSLSDGKPK